MIFNLDVGMKNVTPSIDTRYPADVEILAGKNATFEVFVTDPGVPKEHVFQWYVNGTAVDGATEPTYIRDTSADSGKLSVWCEVTNKAGTVVSRKANLTILKMPVLNTSYPANVEVNVTGSATFKVVVTDTTDTYTYQWYVNGSAVSGATKASYTKTNVAKGSYTVYCKVTNKAGTVTSRTATLTASKLYLKNGASNCTDTTGGWQRKTDVDDHSENGDNYLELWVKGDGETGYAYLLTKNKIKVNDYSQLVVNSDWRKSVSDDGCNVFLGLFNALPTDHASAVSSRVAYVNGGGGYSSPKNTVNVSDLTGSYYIGIVCRVYALSSNFFRGRLSEVYLK